MVPSYHFERQLIEDLGRNAEHRLSSTDYQQIMLALFGNCVRDGGANADAQALLRIALKAHPYATNLADILAAYRELVRTAVAHTMPALTERVALCQEQRLPVPVVVSCERYLDKARATARALIDRYFGIQPVIIAGGDTLSFEDEDLVLRLAVSDVYEALPYKIFEAWTLFDAVGVRYGIIKIDDDSSLITPAEIDIGQVRSLVSHADYIGSSIPFFGHDRTWHQGKCAAPVDLFYGKPFVAPYARGALYFLSQTALTQLVAHYLRFPACLAGELYEDKAVGDLLHMLGIPLMHLPLERVLMIDTAAPERLLPT